MPAAYVRDTWGGDGITAGGSQEAQWQVWAYAPFALEFVFRYEPEGGTGTRTTSTRFTCGPTIPPGGAPLPEIAVLDVQAPAGVLEPGDTITVHYAATSTIGLWETRLSVLGPCGLDDIVGEALARAVDRTVPFVLPAACGLGIPITVGLAAQDAALLLDRMTPPLSGTLLRTSADGALLVEVENTWATTSRIRVVTLP